MAQSEPLKWLKRLGIVIAVCALVLLIGGPYLVIADFVAMTEEQVRQGAILLALLGIGLVHLQRYVMRRSPDLRAADDEKWAKSEADLKRLGWLPTVYAIICVAALMSTWWYLYSAQVSELTRRIVSDICLVALFVGAFVIFSLTAKREG